MAVNLSSVGGDRLLVHKPIMHRIDLELIIPVEGKHVMAAVYCKKRTLAVCFSRWTLVALNI